MCVAKLFHSLCLNSEVLRILIFKHSFDKKLSNALKSLTFAGKRAACQIHKNVLFLFFYRFSKGIAKLNINVPLLITYVISLLLRILAFFSKCFEYVQTFIAKTKRLPND